MDNNDKSKKSIEKALKKLKNLSSTRKKSPAVEEEEEQGKQKRKGGRSHTISSPKKVSSPTQKDKVKTHAIVVNSSDSEEGEDRELSKDEEDAATRSDTSDNSDSLDVELILLNTPSTEQEEVAEFVGCEIMHFECFNRSKGKRTNVVKFSVRNVRVARRARQRVQKKNTTADLQYYQGVTYEKLRSIPVSGWNPTHITSWGGLLDDIKAILLRHRPELHVLDVNVFPGKQFGNITLRDVAMAENFKPLKTSFVGVEFNFKARDDLVIKGFAEGVIDGLQLQDMEQVNSFLEEEVGPLVQFEAIKKGSRNIVMFGFDNYGMSERVVEGKVILKVPRKEIKGGYVTPTVYWAKQYIANPPSSNKKEPDSPAKSKELDRTSDTVSSSRLMALDKQRAEDFRNTKEELERGLKEQADRTIDLINHQGRETTRAFSNTMVTMNQRNYEVMILMQEVNRLERKLAMAETNVSLYRALQNENLDKLIPDLVSSIGKLEGELKAAETELRTANAKPLDIPEYTPLNKSSLLIGCANDDSPVKKIEKTPSKSRKRAAKGKDEEAAEGEEDLIDQVAVRKWMGLIKGKDENFVNYAAKAMWMKDMEPLIASDFRTDRQKIVSIIATLAAYMKVFGVDGKEGKLAEAEINDLINLL